MADRNTSGSISWDFFEKLPDDFHQKVKQKLRHVDENAASTADGVRVPDIVNQLGMAKYYPNQLSLQTVIAIRNDTFSSPKKDTDIPWVILRQIIAINFNFRDKVLNSYVGNQPGADDGDDDDDDDCDDSHSQGVKNMHPLDVFLAIYQCCDSFLQQTLAQKVYTCRMAIPIVYPWGTSGNVFLSLWPIRGVDTNRCTVSEYWKTLSFMRVGGTLKRSKSKLINELLREQEHNTFFHRDCPLGMNERIFSDGSVETTWYIPSTDNNGKTDEPEGAIDMTDSSRMEQINCPVTVFNLRGDAARYDHQKLFLLKASTVIVLLVNHNEFKSQRDVLATIHQSDAFVITLLLTDSHLKEKRNALLKQYQETTKAVESKMKLLCTWSVKKNRQLNSSEIRQLVTTQVSIQLELSDKTTRLADIPELVKDGIMCDEGHNKHCVIAKANATVIQNLTDIECRDDQSNMKAKLLPLQGKAWLDWSNTKKKQTRTGEREEYDKDEPLDKAMLDLRMTQVEQCNAAPAIFSEFVRSLLSMDNDTSLLFFISWMRQYFDKKSRNVQPELVKQLHDAFEMHDQNISKATEKEVKDLNDAERNLANSSLGIEHMFREMGQVYEAFMYSANDKLLSISPKTQAVLECLPVTVAKLLLLGLPLELMDGDAAFVPMKWLKSVFEQLGKRVGNKKICVISTLGIQSSGKSTLLNTMFGLQFSVSAGRCTRGLYAQLLPIVKNHSALTFDYVMLIDTEGLRAPELAGDKVNHDNELALLVIGMADVVLINIKGETIADMENILQMVVHGLLRLRQANNKLKLQQNSVLVHQNVSARDADKQMLQGQTKTVQNLDDMTREVAKHMQIGDITKFKQVIEFNPLRNIEYVCDLWHGCPPMAPSNPNYSEKVVKLAHSVLFEIANKKKCLGIQEIFLKLEALWNGIQTEDFIFSFRNCLEVKAYRSLEHTYQQLVWKLEQFKIEWRNTHIHKMTSCTTDRELDTSGRELISDFNSEMQVRKKSAIKELDDFFEWSDLKDHMIHWKHGKLECLKTISTCLEEDIALIIRKEKERCRMFLKNITERTAREKEINEEATKLANSLKGSTPSSDKLSREFETMWRTRYDAAADGSLNRTEEKDRAIKIDVMNSLFLKNEEHHALIKTEEKAQETHTINPSLKDSIDDSEFTKEHINVKGTINRARKFFPFASKTKEYIKKMHSSVNDIFRSIDEYIADLFNLQKPYAKGEFSGILNIITQEFRDHNARSSDFEMKDVCLIKVAVHVARHSQVKFIELNANYENKYSVQASLREYKTIARRLFDDTFEAMAEDIIAANRLSAELDALVRQCITRGVPLKIGSKIKAKYTVKYDIVVAVMRYLAKEDKFDDYLEYVRRPERYVKQWLTQQTRIMVFDERCDKEKSLYMEWIEGSLSTLIDDIVQKARNTYGTSELCEWVTSFRNELKSTGLAISPTLFQHVAAHSVKDLKHFVNNVVNRMHELKVKIYSEMKDATPTSQTDINRTAEISELFKSLWGCCETCPWCSEPCKKSEAGHENSDSYDCHSCIQHRPSGINGRCYRSTDKLVVESCSYKVQSTMTGYCGDWCGCSTKSSGGCEQAHPCRDYKDFMNKWDIEPSPGMSSSKYWTWFMAKYNQEIADHYGTIPAEIPDSWKLVSKSQALDSLTSY